MIIRLENLKRNLQEKIYPVYLIEGEDSFLRERAVFYIKQATLKEPDLNFTKYEGTAVKADPHGLVMDLQAFPFLSDYRVAEVSEWQPTVAELKGEWKRYLESPSDTSVLIVVNKQKSDNLKKFDCVLTVDCGKADLDTITKYIRFKAMRKNLIISNTVCFKIAEYSLFDMAKIDKETDKLIDYCNGKAEIDLNAVEAVVVKETEYKIFEIVDHIAKKNYTKVYGILNEVTTPAEKQQIFVSLYYHFRRMFYASVFKGTPQELAQHLNERDFVMRKAKEQSALFSPKRLKEVVEKLYTLDGEFKSGKVSLDSAYDLAIFNVLTGENR